MKEGTIKSKSDELIQIYSPASAVEHPIEIVRELVRDIIYGRELAWRLFVRDIKAQYRQTYFGYAWSILPPLVAAATFIFLQNEGITQVADTSIPYAAFAIVGALTWQSFVEAIQSPVNSIVGAKSMLAKLNFPREAVVMSGVYMVTFNILIRTILLCIVLLVWKIPLTLSVLAFPFLMTGLVMLGFSIGLMLVPVGGLYTDVAKAIPIFTQFWMLLTPVLYPFKENGWSYWLSAFNPVAPLIESVRASLVGSDLSTHLVASIIISLLSVTAAFFGMLIFKIVMPHLIVRMGG